MRSPVDFHLIDGYNLVLASGLAKSLSGPGNLVRARERLLGWLAAHLDAAWRARTMVVFDAQKYSVPKSAENHQGMSILFAVDHSNADDLIAELIRRHAAPKQLVVVSSDREIQQAAARRGARGMSSPDWFEQASRGWFHADPSDQAQSADDDADARARVARGAELTDLFPPEILAQLQPPQDPPQPPTPPPPPRPPL